MSGRVTVAVAPLRRAPSHESECLTQALHGEAFETLETSADGAWARVRLSADGYEGWLRSWYGAAADGGEPGLTVTARCAEVRERPAASAPILAALPWQSRVWAAEREGSWTRVRLAGGAVGYLPTRQVETAHPPGGEATSSRIWRTAMRLVGAPYLWGGRTVWGYDCSGLVQAVLAWHGVAVPRDSRDQLLQARERGRFRRPRKGGPPPRAGKGDLLFFGPGPEEANHVALADGKGSFLHAYGQVSLGSLSDTSQHYVPALVSAFIGIASWRSFLPSEAPRSE